MAEPVASLALAIDAAIGWPPGLYRRIGHPVGLFAHIIQGAEARWNQPWRGSAFRRAAGIVLVALLLLVAGGGGWALHHAVLRLAGGWGWLAVAFMAAPGLAQRSLYDHVRPVAAALDAGDAPAARAALGMIVGRDTAELDEAGIARGAIESLAESFCDGVAAPLFWLVALGLPGLWIYKAINTADSLIGHREERWRAFGWAAARLDDLLNLIPARLAGIVICLAGGRGWRIMIRDAGRHASPNAGWTEAAMAGVLGLRLAGPIAYDGVVHDKPWIGDGDRAADAGEIRRALRVYLRACLCLWVVAGGIAWAL
ncbi:adenosylcobinamide-phosphate synthase CbiB [Sphingomonas colocasiae]|uniref:Cobalamin biosynthesis protein CobD n=1 Tax=Sphingomonas colocasiae TaxID=1848973 RepID=A0ABS7PSG9_9SPHN|nr:adenosylcobinamide-phosphate synthase CbiB [Sphingomonas colocasiae]MBY8823620.1 adenosylcobinamide-phosphate synthase CbiB [Sphingomonas colocasiae]